MVKCHTAHRFLFIVACDTNYEYMKINPEEFRNLKIPVFGLPDGTDIRHQFKDLVDANCPSFFDYNEPDVNKVVKYIIYLYDKNSPMPVAYPDIKLRRNECAKLAGFTGVLESLEDLHTLERGVTSPIIGHEPMDEDGVEKPIYGDKEFPLAKMVTEYCISQQNHKWTIIMVNESLFSEYTQEILVPITTFKDQKQKLDAAMVKSKLREELEIIEAKLDGLYLEVFGAKVAQSIARTKATTPERRNLKRKNV